VPRKAGERLGITDATARATLKRVSAKVGMSRQREPVSPVTKFVLR
jgi:hypothetical protein